MASLLLSVMHVIVLQDFILTHAVFPDSIRHTCNLREIVANLEQAYFLVCGFCSCQESEDVLLW